MIWISIVSSKVEIMGENTVTLLFQHCHSNLACTYQLQKCVVVVPQETCHCMNEQHQRSRGLATHSRDSPPIEYWQHSSEDVTFFQRNFIHINRWQTALETLTDQKCCF